MTDLVAAAAGVLAAMGIGGVFGAFVQHRLESRRKVSEKEHELKQSRYLCILILMLAKLAPESGIAKLRSRRPDLPNLEALDDELELELCNAVVFASGDVLRAFVAFLKDPQHRTFAFMADAMRADLWGQQPRLDPELFELLVEVTRERAQATASASAAQLSVASEESIVLLRPRK